jgi:hypothetical protein
MAAAYMKGDVEAGRRYAAQAIAVSQDQRFFGLLLLGMCGRGLGSVLDGHAEEGIQELETALGMLQAGGAHSTYAYYATYLAEAYRATERFAEGLRLTADGLARCERELARVHEPDLLRIDGELRHATGDAAGAEAQLRRAVELVRARGAEVWSARTAEALARVARRQG